MSTIKTTAGNRYRRILKSAFDKAESCKEDAGNRYRSICKEIGIVSSGERMIARRENSARSTSFTAELAGTKPVETFLHEFKGNLSNIDKMHDEYERNYDVKKIINNWRINGKTKNKRFLQYLHRQIGRKENIFLEVTGMTGSGKTRAGFAILLMYCAIVHKNPRIYLDPDDLDKTHLNSCKEFILNAEWPDFVDLYITYSFSQSRHIIARMRPGEFLLQDEWPDLFGRGSKTELAFLGNIIKIAARRRGLNTIFICPDLKKLKQIHYIIDCVAMDEITYKTLALLAFMRKNSEDVVYSGVLIVDVLLLKEIWDFYDENSADIKAHVQSLGGGATVSSQDIGKMAEKLVGIYNGVSNERMKRFYKKTDKTMQVLARTDEEIVSCTTVFEDICMLARFLVKNPGEEKETDVPGEEKNIPFTDKFTFDTVAAVESQYKGNDVLWWKMNIMQGFSHDKIKEALSLDCDQKDISDHVKSVEQWLNTDAVGHVYEKWHAKILRRRDEAIIERVECDGPLGKTFPDNAEYFKDGNVDIYSLKCHRTNRKNVVFPGDEIDPEYKLALKLISERPDKKIRLFLQMYNRFDDNTTVKSLDMSHYCGGSVTLRVKYRKKRLEK